ncbi:MAG TPA: hypothetical protein VGF59_30015 [Bryobacteraceae bacterium]|jgi:hypothetical protein
MHLKPPSPRRAQDRKELKEFAACLNVALKRRATREEVVHFLLELAKLGYESLQKQDGAITLLGLRAPL